MKIPSLYEFGGALFLASPLILFAVLVGKTIRKDWRLIQQGEPIKPWYLRDKVYSDDPLYWMFSMKYMMPNCTIFGFLALLAVTILGLTFVDTTHP